MLAAWLLAQLSMNQPAVILGLVETTLDDDAKYEMIRLVLKGNALTGALEPVGGIGAEELKTKALREIASAQAGAGLPDAAAATFA